VPRTPTGDLSVSMSWHRRFGTDLPSRLKDVNASRERFKLGLKVLVTREMKHLQKCLSCRQPPIVKNSLFSLRLWLLVK